MITSAGARADVPVTPPTISYGFDRGGVFTAVSDGFCEALGWRREEVLGSFAPSLVHPEDRGRLVQQGTLFVGGRDDFDPVWRIRHASGDYRWYRVEATVTHEPDGTVSGGHAILVDVDQAEAARDALVLSERRYRLLVQNSQDVVAHQVDGVLRWISASITVLTGWTPEDLVGHRTLHLWHPDDREAAGALRSSALDGSPSSGLLRLRCKDGHYVHVDVGVHSDGQMDPDGLVVTLHDATARVAALHALQARESEFRLIAENAGDMVALSSLDGRLEWVSPSIERLLGVLPDDVMGRPSDDLLDPDDVPARDAAFAAVAADRTAYFEGRFRHADGRQVWLGVQMRPVHDEVGTVVARLGVSREITTEVAARHALDEREAEYRMLAENAADIVFRLDLRGRFTWLSPSVEAVLGRRAEDLVGRDVDEFLHADDVAARTRAIDTSVDGRTSYEARFQHADGSWRWLAISGHPLVNDAGTVIGRIGNAREIGTEVAAREALERSEAMFRLLAENSADIVICSDLRGVVEWSSPSVETALGWTPAELEGRDFAELLNPEDVPARDQARGVVRAGSSATFLARYQHKDGHWVWLSVTVAPMLDGDGGIVGVVGSGRDATTEVEAERALRRSESDFRLLAENAADVVFRTGTDGRVEWVSPSVSRVLGWRPDEVVGTGLGDLLHPDDIAVRDRGREQLAAALPASFLVRYRHQDGRWVWMSVTGGPIVDAAGALVGHIGSARDATAEVEARQALELREADFRLLAENSADIVFRADPTMVVQWVSPSVLTSIGWEPEEFVGHRITEWVHPDDLETIVGANRSSEPTKASAYDGRFRRKDGGYQWFGVVVRSLLDDDGNVVARVGSARDISDAVAARQAVEASEEMFRSVMDSSAVGMAVVGLDQRFRAVNPALCRMVDRDQQWFRDHVATDLAPLENRDRAAGDGTAYFRDGSSSHLDAVRLLRADGTEVWAQRTVVLVRDREGEPAYFVTQLRDITAELQNEYRRFHDALTGLRNRDWIVDILEEELRTARRSGSDVGVLFIDLDNFKVVNDSLGHEAGDEVLATIAQRLTASLRPGDHVGRFGGDEFVVVIPEVDEVQDLGSICERVLEGIAPQIEIRGHRIAPTASMGVAVSTLDSSAQSLLRDADSALYRAKSAGKKGFHFADEAMHKQAVARLTTEDELRRALAEHELVVHYQPIVRLSDRVVVGHEALVRWQHPVRGLVPPLDFLPVAEESGLIVEIGDEVLRMVGEMLAARADLANISVNLSPVQTSRPWWREKLVSQLYELGVDPRRLSVEVTETAVLSKVDDVARELSSLRELGIGVHLDDFGTGYSSIALLRDLPITGLKLDMSFTRRLVGDGGTTEVLADGLARLADGLGMIGIAEGVETEEQAALLAGMGWSHGQGWLFGRPTPEPA